MTNIKEADSLMGDNASSPADFKLLGESTSLLDQKSGLQSYNRPLSKACENETITTLLAYQKPFEKISLLWEDEFEGIVYLSVSFRVDDCEGKTRRLTKDKTMS